MEKRDAFFYYLLIANIVLLVIVGVLVFGTVRAVYFIGREYLYRWKNEMYNPDEECKAMIATIKRLCEQKNMTLHALAKESGISPSTISYLVNGKTKPQVYTILVLCNVLGVRISDLFDDSVVLAEISGIGIQYITCEEEKLLDCYRVLSDKKRELLRIYVDMLRQYEDELPVEI